MTRPFALKLAVIGILSAGFFAWIQFSHPGIIGVDGYFHIRYAQLIWREGLLDAFPWLAQTLYSSHFADDHFGFHLLQIPYTFGNLITGAKLYGLTFAVSAILLFYAILHSARIRFAECWVLLLLVCAPVFLLRINMPRAIGLSLCVLLLAFLFIRANRVKWLGPLAFLYVWLYGGFILILMLAATAWVTTWLMTRETNPQILIYCFAGTLLGLILHPYFPENLSFLYTSYTEIESGFANHVVSGTEDYPYASSTAVRNAILVWAAVFVGICPYLIKPKRLGQHAFTLFLFSILLLCMYLNVRRFLEYWAPFGLLFAAFALNPFLKSIDLRKEIRTLRGISITAVLLLIFAWGIQDTLVQLPRYRNRDVNPKHYENAAVFLRDNTPKESIVFADWDEFPMLFHFNTHNRYTVGLDPHYLYAYDAKLYDLWEMIREGDEPHAVAQIRDRFDAQYIFSLKTQRTFLRNLDRDKTPKTTIFEDDHAIVHKISSDTPPAVKVEPGP